MVPPSKQDRVASATLTMENPRGKFGDTDLSHLIKPPFIDGVQWFS